MSSADFCWDNTGSVLLEWVVVAGLLAALTTGFGLGMTTTGTAIQNRATSVLVYQFLATARQAALALSVDTLISISPTALYLTNAGTQARLGTLTIPSGTTVRSTTPLGFKASGHSKFAGTIWIETGERKTAITVGVGFGQIRMR